MIWKKGKNDNWVEQRPLFLERQLNHRYRLIVTDRGAPLPYFALEIPSNVFHASRSCRIAAHYSCSRRKKVTLIAARIVSVRNPRLPPVNVSSASDYYIPTSPF